MIPAVVLAAGAGKRMGAVKPLLEIDGEPALARVIEAARGAGMKEIIVVLGHAAGGIKERLDLSGCRTVVNPDYSSGMASSLRAGIGALPPEARGFIVLHADMPYVSPKTIESVIAAGKAGARIAAPVYRGKRGFPVYIDRDCIAGLVETLLGEIGARDYIAAHPEELLEIPVDDPGAVTDLDTPEDLRKELTDAGLR